MKKRVEVNMTPEIERMLVRPQEPVPEPMRRPDVVPEPRPLDQIPTDARLLLCLAYTDKFVNKQRRSYDDAYAICRALGFKPQECVDARQILRYRHEHPNR
jgi:hypothetical protein